MVTNKIHHIGIAVQKLDQAVNTYGLLGLSVSKIENVPHMGVKVAFLNIGDSRLELLEPTSNESPIARFLEKKGEGIHHICIEVDDLKKATKLLKSQKIQFVYDEPKPGADHMLVNFIHPKSCHGVLLELCQTH